MDLTKFEGHHIYSTLVDDDNINIVNIIKEFKKNSQHYQYTHYINKRWENIYLNPQLIPSILPLLSYAVSKSIEVFSNKIQSHQTLFIPHELLGYEKNEFWFNTATKGQSTRIHNHINKAFISGIFYLQVPENSANLFFKSGEETELEVEGKTRKMILFPSVLDHYVPENRSSKTRISLAFNCYIFPISPYI